MIITHTTNSNGTSRLYVALPDQFVSKKEKESEDWIKTNLDYFYTVAVSQYHKNKKNIAPNYALVKGELSLKDFYQDSCVTEFINSETILDDYKAPDQLPDYVQPYSILLPPINTIMGEMSKRPDNTYIKAFDEDSKAEELRFKTDLLTQYVTQLIKDRIIATAAQEGQDISEEDLQRLTAEEVAGQLSTYTSQAEKWAASMLDALKVRFSMKEKSEDAMRDLLHSAREYFHIFEDNSDVEFNIQVENPVNVWYLCTPNTKYISDPLDESAGAYAAGTIHLMEISEIMHKYNLTKEEIKHLTDRAHDSLFPASFTSPLVSGAQETGIDSIRYNTYMPGEMEDRLLNEYGLEEGGFGSTVSEISQYSNMGRKFVVIQAYWHSKVKIGLLTYIDKEGQPVSTTVDEEYKSGMHPNEISLEWGWVNQWWKGTKIGDAIYKNVEALEFLPYCPIIGAFFEPKNISAPKSFVDTLKPFQAIYNIYINKLYEKIQQDWGNVLYTSIRTISTPKDADPADAIEIAVEEAKARGVLFNDDSPENTKGQSNFNQTTVLPMSKGREMQEYLQLAQMIKQEAWELVGITRQRMGSVAATETATGTNTALAQSYAQTEPWFTHHEYTMNRVYQALLDAALYIESQKETSTIRFLNGEGQHSFVQINGCELKLKNMFVLVTSRSEDARNFQELRMLSQAMLQNGASAYEVAELYNTKSARHIKEVLKKVKDEQMQMQQQAQQLEQQKLEQQQQQFVQQQQIILTEKEKDREQESLNKALDRASKERVALITASGFGKVTPPDQDQNSIPDVYETQRITNEVLSAQNDHQQKMQQIALKQQEILNKNDIAQKELELKQKELDVKKEDIKSKERIAKTNRNKYSK